MVSAVIQRQTAHSQRAHGTDIAARDCAAAGHCDAATDCPGAAQRGAAGHSHGAVGRPRTVDEQRTRVNLCGTGEGIGRVQRQRAGALLRQAAGTTDRCGRRLRRVAGSNIQRETVARRNGSDNHAIGVGDTGCVCVSNDDRAEVIGFVERDCPGQPRIERGCARCGNCIACVLRDRFGSD